MPVLTRRREEDRDERRAVLQARLLVAVEELLVEGVSYADLSVEAIIKRAGVARTTFYEYFGDKRELLLRLGAEATTDLLEIAAVWDAGEDGIDAGRLRDLLRAFLRRNRERPLLRAITEAAAYDSEVRAAWLKEQDFLIGLIERHLESERDAGRIAADLPVKAMAAALHWMVQQTCFQEMVVRERFAEDEYLDALADLWTRGLQPPR